MCLHVKGMKKVCWLEKYQIMCDLSQDIIVGRMGKRGDA